MKASSDLTVRAEVECIVVKYLILTYCNIAKRPEHRYSSILVIKSLNFKRDLMNAAFRHSYLEFLGTNS